MKKLHSYLRPTVLGSVLAVVGIAAAILGPTFDYAGVTAAGLALAVAFVIDAVAAFVARFGMRRFPHIFLPETYDVARVWHQQDHTGATVAELTRLPDEGRGIFRNFGTRIRWTSPLGMWRSSALRPLDDLVVRPPDTDDSDTSDDTSTRLSRPRAFGEKDLFAPYARPYAPGDSGRDISWKTSARRGELMTRVTDHRTPPDVLVVVDTFSTGKPSGQAVTEFEPVVDYLARLVQSRRPDDPHLLLTDGNVVAVTDEEIEQFLAGVRPTNHGSLSDRLSLIGTTMSAGKLRGFVVAPESTDTSDFVKAIDNDRATRGFEVVHVPQTVATAGAATPAVPPKETHSSPWEKSGRTLSRTQVISSRIIGTLALESLLISSLILLTSLVKPGAWLTYSIIVTALMVADAGLVQTRGRISPVRALITDAVIVLAGFITITTMVRMETGGWWTRDLIDTIASEGFDALVFESFPIAASFNVNVCMIVLISIVLMVIRPMIVLRRLQMLCAAAPLALMAAQNEFFSTNHSTIFLILVITAFITLLGRIRFLIIPAVVATIAVLLTPILTPFVQFLDLTIGTQIGLFSSNSVNPLVDLSRNLRSNSDDIALTYRSSTETPQYLRMASLDDFDGETWAFDNGVSTQRSRQTSQDGESTSVSGALRVGDGSAPGGFSARFAFSDGSPLLQYASVFGQQQNLANQNLLRYTNISIDNLVSRFMPLAGLPTMVQMTESEWQWSRDATVFSDSKQVDGTDDYWNLSAYVDPFTSSDAFLSSYGIILQGLESARYFSAASSMAPTADESGMRSLQQWDFYDENEELAASTYAQENYTALPDDVPAAITDFVDTAQSQGIQKATSADADLQAQALSYLLDFFTDDSFTYSLDAPDGNGTDNMEVISTFLDRRSGYCVHYATSFAVLGRALGLPTRVIMGYLPNGDAQVGQENGRYEVTNQQLHAWVESYVEGVGWLPFDVTPASDSTEAAGGEGTGDADADGAAENGADRDTADERDPAQAEEEDPAEEDQTEDTPEGEDEAAGANTDDGNGSGLGTGGFAWWTPPAWLRVTFVILGGVALAVLLVLTPLLIRVGRQRRRGRKMTALTAQGQPGAASLQAWDEVADSAQDAGLVIPVSATEASVVELVQERIGAVAVSGGDSGDGNGNLAARLGKLQSAVEQYRYGGEGDSSVTGVGGDNEAARRADLSANLTTTVDLVRQGLSRTDTRPRVVRWLRKIFPLSVFRVFRHD